MADLKKEQEAMEKMAEPPCNEAEILKGSKEADISKAADKKEEVVAEEELPKLPKLSAADFRAYNSMAEHMDYFVRTPLSFPTSSHPTFYSALLANNLLQYNSTTTFAKHGTRSTTPV